MLTDWLRRVIGQTHAEGGAVGARAWPTQAPDQSQRLARLGLASGGVGVEPDPATPLPRSTPGAKPDAAPQPTIRRDVGVTRHDPGGSASQDEAGPRRCSAAPSAPTAEPRRQPRRADRPQAAPSAHRKRATYRLPTALLHRLRTASKRTHQFQYQIVADALRAHLPTLESEAGAMGGEAEGHDAATPEPSAASTH